MLLAGVKVKHKNNGMVFHLLEYQLATGKALVVSGSLNIYSEHTFDLEVTNEVVTDTVYDDHATKIFEKFILDRKQSLSDSSADYPSITDYIGIKDSSDIQLEYLKNLLGHSIPLTEILDKVIISGLRISSHLNSINDCLHASADAEIVTDNSSPKRVHRASLISEANLNFALNVLDEMKLHRPDEYFSVLSRKSALELSLIDLHVGLNSYWRKYKEKDKLINFLRSTKSRLVGFPNNKVNPPLVWYGDYHDIVSYIDRGYDEGDIFCGTDYKLGILEDFNITTGALVSGDNDYYFWFEEIMLMDKNIVLSDTKLRNLCKVLSEYEEKYYESYSGLRGEHKLLHGGLKKYTSGEFDLSQLKDYMLKATSPKNPTPEISSSPFN